MKNCNGRNRYMKKTNKKGWWQHEDWREGD